MGWWPSCCGVSSCCVGGLMSLRDGEGIRIILVLILDRHRYRSATRYSELDSDCSVSFTSSFIAIDRLWVTLFRQTKKTTTILWSFPRRLVFYPWRLWLRALRPNNQSARHQPRRRCQHRDASLWMPWLEPPWVPFWLVEPTLHKPPKLTLKRFKTCWEPVHKRQHKAMLPRKEARDQPTWPNLPKSSRRMNKSE